MPRVSIVTPCYNAERYVGRTIESVRAQTFTDWEHVVVDDGSTDGSAGVVEACVRFEPRLRLVRQPNGGLSNARNRGYRECPPDSDYLLFLDADDCLEPGMLHVMVRHLDEHRGAGMVHCRCLHIDEEGRRLGSREVGRWVPGGGLFRVAVLPDDQLETPFVSEFVYAGSVPSCTLIRRSVYELTPGWDEDLGPAEDTDMFSHIALRSQSHLLQQELTRYRLHGAQMSSNEARVIEKDQLRYRKWAEMDGFTRSQRELVDAALYFRNGPLMARLWVAWGNAHLRAGHLIEGARSYLRSARLVIANLRSEETGRAEEKLKGSRYA